MPPSACRNKKILLCGVRNCTWHCRALFSLAGPVRRQRSFSFKGGVWRTLSDGLLSIGANTKPAGVGSGNGRAER